MNSGMFMATEKNTGVVCPGHYAVWGGLAASARTRSAQCSEVAASMVPDHRLVSVAVTVVLNAGWEFKQ